jgi:hypothetical protein
LEVSNEALEGFHGLTGALSFLSGNFYIERVSTGTPAGAETRQKGAGIMPSRKPRRIVVVLAVLLSLSVAPVHAVQLRPGVLATPAGLVEALRSWFANLWTDSLQKNGVTIDPDGVTGTTTNPETRNDNGVTIDPNGATTGPETRNDNGATTDPNG